MLYDEFGEGTLQTADGLTLRCRAWLPAVPPRALIVLVHGYAEHIDRYDYVADRLIKAAYAVYGFDMRGHGRSPGKRAYIDSFDDLVRDLAAFHEAVATTFPGLPLFILAHSLGATVTLHHLIKNDPELAGVVLSGAAVLPGSDIPKFLLPFAGMLGDLLPHLPTIKLNAHAMSKDPAVVEAYRNDPLVHSAAIPARSGASINRAFVFLQKNLGHVHTPLLFLHGGNDKLIDPAGSRYGYEHVGSEDKTLDVMQGLAHEIMNEPEKAHVLDRIIAWIEARL